MAAAFGLTLLVGAGVFLLAPTTHMCVAVLRPTGAATPVDVAALHKDIFYFASRHLSDTDWMNVLATCPDGPPSDGMLALCAATTRRTNGPSTLRAAVEAYIVNHAEQVQRTRVTPTDSEQLLSRYAGDLRARLETVQDQVDAAIANVPDDNPRVRRDALVARWQTTRAGFTEVRAALKQATEELAALEKQRAPTHGIVPTDERRSALEADLALQQDLAELTVNLAELKLYLLNVWQEAAEPLEVMTSASADLVQAATANESAGETSGDLAQLQFEKLAQDAQKLGDELGVFASTWALEFAAIKNTEPDAETAELIDAHRRIRSALRDFLLVSDGRLETINQYIRSLRESLAANAGYHVVLSTLLRRHATVRATFGRFQFAAGQIEPTDNFRLDIALRGARGLRRRSRQAIRVIDERLAAIAVQRARQRQIEQIKRTKQRVAELRIEASDAIDRIVTIQDDLNIATGLTEGFLEAVVRAEMSALRTDDLADYLAATEDELARLGVARTANAVNMELVSCEVVGPPLHRGRRWWLAGLGALATLALMTLGQWWVGRRS